ncbi:G/T mismatch-specific thymine DNA glycosylase-like [Prorops nasuta]|uniref:G/T mismatch-specific thymine DNA glycosylase-like n=1 Tax=Prorops nasuta TaxID=863751 RepID=UPI0034CE093B
MRGDFRKNSLNRIMAALSLSKLKKKAPEKVQAINKKKIDRFDGLSEEEVQKYTLPDYLKPNLDLIFIGINPSLMAAHRGRYYAGPGNHFYKLLHESGIIPKFVSFEEDYKLLQYGIGLTNIVERATKSSADLKKLEIKEGAKIVEEKIKFFKPKIAIFNGKCIFEVYANITSKSGFQFGLQAERIGDTSIWVVPSSSARCSNFPRMTDKLHFYTALKKYLSFLKGEIQEIDIREFIFEGKCKQAIPTTSKMWRRKNLSAFLNGGRVANKDTMALDTSEENVAVANSTEFIVKEIISEDDFKDEQTVNQSEHFLKLKVDEYTKNETEKQTHEQIKTKGDNDITNNLKESSLQETSNLRIRKTKASFRSVPEWKSIKDDKPLDFVNLIKQRLSEKTEKNKFEEHVSDTKRIKLT